MNRVLLFVMLIMLMKWLPAQEYITKGATPDLHLEHRVAPKETWYAIARTYNLSPQQIASYNRVDINTPLEIGQSLKIPLTSANFSQNDTKGADEKLVPVYHIVQDKEWMYRISVNHNKVPIERLEKWNSISRDEAKAGMKLIVGHLKTKQGGSTSAATSPDTSSPPVRQPAPAHQAATSQSTTAAQTTRTPAPQRSAGNGGYFSGQFVGQGKTRSGVAGVFKSTSGWNDGKYYALMNNVTVGTIIRIVFPQTNKSVYAKVLGELPDMKESAGLALRISDAAAKELGATVNKFSVDVAF